MFSSGKPIRLWIVTGVLLGAFALLQARKHPELVVFHPNLQEVPYTLGSWNGTERPIDEEIMQYTGTTEYTNRVYSDRLNGIVQLYIGYYASQKEGLTVHSPKNCLPGAGWDPVYSGYATISVPSGDQIVVNQYVVQRDNDKVLVFYWYQGRGRVIASEYWGKFWLAADAISRNRTDDALVRLITPVGESETKAIARLSGFTQMLFPKLETIIPK